MNGGLTSPGVYAGLHISPQMSAAAAAAYGRTPMVTALPAFFFFFFLNAAVFRHKHMAFGGNALIHILFSEMKSLAPFDKSTGLMLRSLEESK